MKAYVISAAYVAAQRPWQATILRRDLFFWVDDLVIALWLNLRRVVSLAYEKVSYRFAEKVTIITSLDDGIWYEKDLNLLRAHLWLDIRRDRAHPGKIFLYGNHSIEELAPYIRRIRFELHVVRRYSDGLPHFTRW